MLNLVVLKRFGIFAILFFEMVSSIPPGDPPIDSDPSNYFRQGRKDQRFSTGPPRHLDPSNYYSGIKRPEPRPTQSPHWSSSHYGAPQRDSAKTPAWYNPPRSPYGHYCIGLNKHIKDGDIIFQHFQLIFF